MITTPRFDKDMTEWDMLMLSDTVSIRPVQDPKGLFLIRSYANIYPFVAVGLVFLYAIVSICFNWSLPGFPGLVCTAVLIASEILALSVFFLQDMDFVFFTDRVELRFRGFPLKTKKPVCYRRISRNRISGAMGPDRGMVLMEMDHMRPNNKVPLWLMHLLHPFRTMLLFVPKSESKEVYAMLKAYAAGANHWFSIDD